jgi:hypothetical protein
MSALENYCHVIQGAWAVANQSKFVSVHLLLLHCPLYMYLLLLLLLFQSTYVEHLHQHCTAIKRSIHCVNLGGRAHCGSSAAAAAAPVAAPAAARTQQLNL